MLKVIEQKNQRDLVEKLLSRSQMNDEKVNQTVEIIVKAVKAYGDEALFNYTKALDGADLSALRVSDQEMKDFGSTMKNKYLNLLNMKKKKGLSLDKG